MSLRASCDQKTNKIEIRWVTFLTLTAEFVGKTQKSSLICFAALVDIRNHLVMGVVEPVKVLSHVFL